MILLHNAHMANATGNRQHHPFQGNATEIRLLFNIYYFTDYTPQSSACQAARTFVHKLFMVTGTNVDNAIFLHRLNEKHHIISQ